MAGNKSRVARYSFARTGVHLLQRQMPPVSRPDGVPPRRDDQARRGSENSLQNSIFALGGKRVHLIGIGGIGMSALARWFLAQNWAVSGSDLTPNSITKELTKEGVKVKIGHKKSYISPNLDLVVYNRAILKENPELVASRSLGVLTAPYAKVLGAITEKHATIAITGSHGKTTTTALAGLTLVKGGLDPTIFVGTNLNELGGKNIKIGRGKYLVLEADDFGGALVEYSPTIAIITNIDKEHLDFYKSFSNLQKTFLAFLARTRNGGVFILNRDDKNLWSLKSKIVTIAKKKKIKTVVWYSVHGSQSREVKKIIKIPGEHNLSNALAAYHLGIVLKIPEKKILKAIGEYRGAWRRMEYRGRCQVSGVRCQVYDDYAHHPTEIKATLRAFREKFPRAKIVCVFQPHQTERLKLLFKEFQAAFDNADITLILPVYQVAGRDKVSKKFDSATLVHAIQRKQPKKLIFYLSDPKNLKRALAALLHPTPYTLPPRYVLVMMGAGNIIDYTRNLITKFKRPA